MRRLSATEEASSNLPAELQNKREVKDGASKTILGSTTPEHALFHKYLDRVREILNNENPKIPNSTATI